MLNASLPAARVRVREAALACDRRHKLGADAPNHVLSLAGLLDLQAEPDNCAACRNLSDAIDEKVRAALRVRAAGRLVDRFHGLDRARSGHTHAQEAATAANKD
jgi:hypothetical protein